MSIRATYAIDILCFNKILQIEKRPECCYKNTHCRNEVRAALSER